MALSSTQYRMVALDLDGTLLGPDHQVSSASVKYLRYLHDKGFIISIATGRSALAISAVIRSLDLQYPTCSSKGFPIVCVNGAKGIEVVEDRKIDQDEKQKRLDERYAMTELFHSPVPNDLATKTLKLAKKLGCVVNYYIDHDIYAQPTSDEHYTATKRYSQLTGIKFTYCSDDYEEAMKRGLSSKLLILCKQENIDEIFNQVSNELSNDAMVIRGSPPFFVEILRNDVCKGKGLEKMCEKLGVGLDECISFGDGENDLEFLQVAGLGIAMKNGRDSVKSIANKVTEFTNAEVIP